jgi:hypothetical protein
MEIDKDIVLLKPSTSDNDYDYDLHLIKEIIATEVCIYGNDICEKETDDRTTIHCNACFKTFTTKNSLKRHEERNPVCLKWLATDKSSQPNVYKDSSFNFINFMEDIQKKIITMANTENKCNYCSVQFSNIGNLHKHYKCATVCNQLALHSFFKHVKLLDASVTRCFSY